MVNLFHYCPSIHTVKFVLEVSYIFLCLYKARGIIMTNVEFALRTLRISSSQSSLIDTRFRSRSVQGINTPKTFLHSILLRHWMFTLPRVVQTNLLFNNSRYFLNYILFSTSWKHAYIILTLLKPHFDIVKLGFTGAYIIFLISAQKHRLWVLVRTASARRF